MHIYIYIGSRKNSSDEPICKEGIEMQMSKMGMWWTQQGKEKMGGIERIALKHMHYQA